jgi:hypothetical protein
MDASKEVHIEVNAKKNEVHVFVSSADCRKNHNIKVANKSFQNVAKFK